MLPKSIQELQKHFQKYPGIGPRQASRFVFYLLKAPAGTLNNFIDSLQELKKEVALCENCYLPAHKKEGLCRVCKDQKRKEGAVCVVEKENDALNMEKLGLHGGTYFVLGENVSPVGESQLAKSRVRELASRAQKNKNTEIILALNNTREGNFTSMYIQEVFKKKNLNKNTKLTRLGRGLSTGSELEYADEETLKNAIEGRK